MKRTEAGDMLEQPSRPTEAQVKGMTRFDYLYKDPSWYKGPNYQTKSPFKVRAQDIKQHFGSGHYNSSWEPDPHGAGYNGSNTAGYNRGPPAWLSNLPYWSPEQREVWPLKFLPESASETYVLSNVPAREIRNIFGTLRHQRVIKNVVIGQKNPKQLSLLNSRMSASPSPSGNPSPLFTAKQGTSLSCDLGAGLKRCSEIKMYEEKMVKPAEYLQSRASERACGATWRIVLKGCRPYSGGYIMKSGRDEHLVKW